MHGTRWGWGGGGVSLPLALGGMAQGAPVAASGRGGWRVALPDGSRRAWRCLPARSSRVRGRCPAGQGHFRQASPSSPPVVPKGGQNFRVAGQCFSGSRSLPFPGPITSLLKTSVGFVFRKMSESERAKQRLGRCPVSASAERYAVIVGRCAACRVGWLFPAPEEVGSPNESPRRTRHTGPGPTLGHNPDCRSRLSSTPWLGGNTGPVSSGGLLRTLCATPPPSHGAGAVARAALLPLPCAAMEGANELKRRRI